MFGAEHLMRRINAAPEMNRLCHINMTYSPEMNRTLMDRTTITPESKPSSEGGEVSSTAKIKMFLFIFKKNQSIQHNYVFLDELNLY